MASQDLGDQSVPEVLESVRLAYEVGTDKAIPEWAFYASRQDWTSRDTSFFAPTLDAPTLPSKWFAILPINYLSRDLGASCALFQCGDYLLCHRMQEDGDWTKLQQVSGFASGQAFSINPVPLKPVAVTATGLLPALQDFPEACSSREMVQTLWYPASRSGADAGR